MCEQMHSLSKRLVSQKKEKNSSTEIQYKNSKPIKNRNGLHSKIHTRLISVTNT